MVQRQVQCVKLTDTLIITALFSRGNLDAFDTRLSERSTIVKKTQSVTAGFTIDERITFIKNDINVNIHWELSDPTKVLKACKTCSNWSPWGLSAVTKMKSEFILAPLNPYRNCAVCSKKMFGNPKRKKMPIRFEVKGGVQNCIGR